MINVTSRGRLVVRSKPARRLLPLAALVAVITLAACVAYPYQEGWGYHGGYYHHSYGDNNYGWYSRSRSYNGNQWGGNGDWH
jgi:hypothetical protein